MQAANICVLQVNIALSDNEEECANSNETIQQTSSSTLISSKKRKKPTECFLNVEKEKSKDEKEIEMKPKRKRKKKISDLLTETVPKPGVPADVQKMLNEHFGAKRSVIELEELKLPDSCFLPANDLTHSFTSYLKEICPKWAKLRKKHTEKSSVVMLVICGSALRCLELIRMFFLRSMATFKGDGKVMKLFAKHLKIQEQMQMLEKEVVHVGVGTPGRIKALIQQEGLKLTSLKYFILDWNHRDQKLRRLIDIPEEPEVQEDTQITDLPLQCTSFQDTSFSKDSLHPDRHLRTFSIQTQSPLTGTRPNSFTNTAWDTAFS